jgi:hypothetical protein
MIISPGSGSRTPTRWWWRSRWRTAPLWPSTDEVINNYKTRQLQLRLLLPLGYSRFVKRVFFLWISSAVFLQTCTRSHHLWLPRARRYVSTQQDKIVARYKLNTKNLHNTTYLLLPTLKSSSICMTLASDVVKKARRLHYLWVTYHEII